MTLSDTGVAAESYRLEEAPCPLGCEANDEWILSGRDRLLKLPGEFSIVRCLNCRLIRTNPRPSADTIGYFYPDAYSPYQGKPQREISLRDRFAARVHRLVNAWRTPDVSPGRLFEFGCGTGRYLQWMQHCGWNVTGLEMSSTAAAKARSLGFPVHAGTMETAPAPAEPFDLCVGWMVVEHLHDPVMALRSLSTWTRAEGWLAISVPNIASQEAAIFRDSWYALDLPRHLYHFTPPTMTALLLKAGWRVQEIYQQRNLDNFIASIGLLLEQMIPGPAAEKLARHLVEFPTNVPLHFLTYPTLFPVACVLAAFGETGRMTVLAQKI